MAKATLVWSQDAQRYLWRDTQESGIVEPETWKQRLSAYTSFSFQGREGQLTLLKEMRPRGNEGYWYAYRRRGKRTVKRYVGRTGDLDFDRLEQIARTLMEQPAPSKPDERPVDLLLLSKTRLPRLHSALLVRDHLLRQLDRSLEQKLTLISAPAGSGKTTLVRQWIAARQESMPPVAWVSLDADDNDASRFWRYVMTACLHFQSGIQDALTLLQTKAQPPFEPSIIETALTLFLNELAQSRHGGVLVLDDYHVITSKRIQENMTFFLDYLPEDMHVIITTRSEPAFPLARLRARNELYEIQSAALRFTQAETRRLLQQETGASVLPEVAQQITTHFEGWAAGLRLLLYTLQAHTAFPEMDAILHTFASRQDSLQDYFVTEVLNTQPEPMQRFLLQTSVLGRLNASLCDALTGSHDSQHILAELARLNLFLEPLGAGEWYRYHGLFAEAMQQEARQRLGAETLSALSSQASLWYEQHGFYTEAIEAALHARNYPRAIVLIERLLALSPHENQQRDYHALYHWLSQLPTEQLTQHPVLCLAYAIARLFTVVTWQPSGEHLESIEGFLRIAEEHFQAENNHPRLGEIYAFRALLAWRQDDSEQAGKYARHALTLLSLEQRSWRCLSLSMAGKAALLHLGEVTTSRQLLEEAYALCQEVDNHYFKRTTANMLARTYTEQGELHRAADYYQRALDEARAHIYSNDIAHALLGLAHISYEWNELATAQQQIQEALAINEQLGYTLHQVQGTLQLARISHARGESQQAIHRLHMLANSMKGLSGSLPVTLIREIQALQAQQALAAGDLATVQRWIHSTRDEAVQPFTAEREALVLARWLHRQHRDDEALDLLQRLRREAEASGHMRSVYEIQALLALLYAAQKQYARAQQTLRSLLEQTYVEGYMRLFLDEGKAMMDLLLSLLPSRTSSLAGYIQRLLHASPEEPQPAPALLEPLSPQEQRVLYQLSLGRSNADIAQQLIVSVNTVRTQVQSIYRKLNVHNRASAIKVAHRLGLLNPVPQQTNEHHTPYRHSG